MSSWLGGLFGPSEDQLALREAAAQQRGYHQGFDDGRASAVPEVRHEILDVRPELAALDATLRGLGLILPPPAGTALPPIDWRFPTLDERKMRSLMQRLTNAVTRIRALAEGYKSLGELITAVESGSRAVHKVTVVVRGQGNQKNRSIEVRCTPGEAVGLLKEEQRRLYAEIHEAQEEARQAINEVADTPPAPVAEGTRKIRRNETNS